jgi:raffinose/stachyose/melibiose transport system permease protein
MNTVKTRFNQYSSSFSTLNYGRLLTQFAVYTLFITLTIIVLYPMLWIVTNSFKTDIDLFEKTWELPDTMLWGNYERAWDFGIGKYIVNSIIVTSVSVVGTVGISASAAYALSRFKFPFRNFWFFFILGGLMLAPQVTLIPLFRTLVSLGIYNTYLALIIPYIAFGIPFSTFLIRAYMMGLPRELEEAAYIDGAGPFGVFWYVIIPLSRPVLASVMVIQAMRSWNEFMFALTFIESDSLRTLPIGIMSFTSALRMEYTTVMAGLTIAALPMILVFLLAQRFFVRGLAAGAIKG